MIQITDKYYLDSDSLQYIVCEKYVVSDKNSKRYGEVKYRNIAYCGNLMQVKNFLVEKEIRENLSILENIDLCIELSHKIDENIKEVENGEQH